MTEREHELLRELIDLRVKNKFLRERVGYLRGDIETQMLRLTSERDFARAEVEMLRGVGCMEDGDGPCGACRKCAYRRGAEAMREAAADLFQGNKPGLAAIPTWSAFIRALPIPEDKR